MATLYDLAQAYLNRGLPDISGIFGDNTNNTLSPIDFGEEEPVSPQGLTPEQLALLYSQYNNVGGDGGEMITIMILQMVELLIMQVLIHSQIYLVLQV